MTAVAHLILNERQIYFELMPALCIKTMHFQNLKQVEQPNLMVCTETIM